MADAQLTVGQLIELLDVFSDHTMPVYVEGCDCIRRASGVAREPGIEHEWGAQLDPPGILITQEGAAHMVVVDAPAH